MAALRELKGSRGRHLRNPAIPKGLYRLFRARLRLAWTRKYQIRFQIRTAMLPPRQNPYFQPHPCSPRPGQRSQKPTKLKPSQLRVRLLHPSLVSSCHRPLGPLHRMAVSAPWPQTSMTIRQPLGLSSAHITWNTKSPRLLLMSAMGQMMRRWRSIRTVTHHQETRRRGGQCIHQVARDPLFAISRR